MSKPTPSEIMAMDLSHLVNDEVVAEANRRWTAIKMPAKSDVEWSLIAKPQTQRYDSKLGLYKAIIAVWHPNASDEVIEALKTVW